MVGKTVAVMIKKLRSLLAVTAILVVIALLSTSCLIATEEASGDTVIGVGADFDRSLLDPAPDATAAQDVIVEPTPTTEPRATVEPEVTVEPEATIEPEATVEPEATIEPEATASPTATETPAPTATPEATSTPEPTTTPVATAEPAATAEPSATPNPLDYTSVRETECPVAATNPKVVCQFVTLPENDEDPTTGRVVELMVATIDNGDPASSGPVVILQGGPGVGIVDSLEQYIDTGLDVIVVDQRGTGRSLPSLDCSEYGQVYADLLAVTARDPETVTKQVAANRDCRDRLVTAGVDPNAFNTEQNADDIALLRLVLGYDEWNLYGSSYGTRLALTVMRDHPEGIRSVVLDAVLPLEVDFFGELPANAARSIDALVASCSASTDCAERYGDLKALIDQAATVLDDAPQSFSTTRPVSGESVEVIVDGPAFRSYLFDQLYLTSAIPSLPAQIQLAANGDVEDLALSVLQRQDPEKFDFAEGMYWSVFCQDEVAFHDPEFDEAVLVNQSESFRVAFEHPEVEDICDVWQVAAAPAVENEPVASSVPTLLFSGGLDPVTPPEWAAQVTASLDNSFLVYLANQGHGASNACVGEILAAFIANPAVAPGQQCVSSDPITFD